MGALEAQAGRALRHCTVPCLDAVRAAHVWSRRLGHGATTAGHVLAGLMEETASARVAKRAAKALGSGKQPPAAPSEQPFDVSVVPVLALAERLGSTSGTITPAHLLLALSAAGGEPVAATLAALRKRVRDVREECCRELTLDEDLVDRLAAETLQAFAPDAPIVELVQTSPRSVTESVDVASGTLARWALARREHAARSVRWAWGPDGTWADELAPLWHRRHGFPQRRVSAGRPLARAATEEYGYDQDDRMIIARRFDPTGQLSEVALLEYEADTVTRWECSTYNIEGDWTVRAAQRARLCDDRVEELVTLSRPPRVHERYVYEAEKLVAAVRDGSQEDVQWNAEGRLAQVERVWSSGEREVVYRRATRGRSLAQLLREVEDALVQAVSVAVPDAAISELCWCMALHYNADEASLPPGITLCPISVRDALLDEHGLDPWFIWNPAEWMSYVRHRRGPAVVPDVELGEEHAELFREAEQEITLTDALHEQQSLFQRVAARLGERPWSSALPVGEPWVVYAVDFELDHLQANLEATLYEEQQADLLARGWVH